MTHTVPGMPTTAMRGAGGAAQPEPGLPFSPTPLTGLTSIMNTNRPLACRYTALAVGQLRLLGAANAYIPRIVIVNQPLAARETFFYGIRVPVGSYFWAYNVLSDQTGFQMAETCNLIPFFVPYRYVGNFTLIEPLGGNPRILTEPRPITGDGAIDFVLFRGNAPAVANGIVALFFAVPGEATKGIVPGVSTPLASARPA